MCLLENNLLEANFLIFTLPFIPGEVFVLNDGGEVDLDLGKYRGSWILIFMKTTTSLLGRYINM